MIDTWINTCIKEYYDWLKDKTQITTSADTDWYSISTPFQGLYNDHIEIYAKKENDIIFLSDDGDTLSSLELLGANPLRSNKRKEIFDMILLNYGISLNNNNELVTSGTIQDFNQRKYNLISAISEISDMSMLATHNVVAMFYEDVKSFLEANNILYTPQFIVKGSTGIDFTFDFQIAGLKKELVIKSFNSLNKLNVPNFLFSWEDIKTPRESVTGKELKGLAIINDINKNIKQDYIKALESKGTGIIKWSDRNTPESIQKLVA